MVKPVTICAPILSCVLKRIALTFFRWHLQVRISLQSALSLILQLPVFTTADMFTLPQPSRLPNRELYFTRSPRAVQKIYTQTDQTPTIVNPTPAAAVFFIQYLFYTADTFTCFTRTYMNNQSDTVVNWLLEQFVTSHVLYEYRSNKS